MAVAPLRAGKRLVRLAALDSRDEAGLPAEEGAEGDEDHKSHWWSRQH